jgi:hypothetical protein
LQNPVLLDRLVAEKLEHEAAAVRSQGWKWVEVCTRFSLRPHLWAAPNLGRASRDERRGDRDGGGLAGRV